MSSTSSERTQSQPATALSACLSLIHGKSTEISEPRKSKNYSKPTAGVSLKVGCNGSCSVFVCVLYSILGSDHSLH